MPIINSELKHYYSALSDITTPAQNGGRMSAVVYTPYTRGALFRDVSQAERTAGSTVYRKLFLRVDNAQNIALLSPKLWVQVPTAGDDYVFLMPGTQTDTQADLSGTRVYGTGVLRTAVAAGASAFNVNIESEDIGNTAWVQAGDTLRITAQGDNIVNAGATEFVTVDTATFNEIVGGTSYWAITITGTLTNAFDPATGTVRIASVYGPSDVQTSVSGYSKSSAAGTFTSSAITTGNLGTVQQTWTLTATSNTVFTVSGDTLGTLGNYDRSSAIAPSNPNFAGTYFSIPSTAWGGTWAIGDSITFTTNPASIPFWLKRVVPAGAATIGLSGPDWAITGESAA
jgi:hypothetical protein